MTQDNIAVAKGPVASWINKRSDQWWFRYYEFRCEMRHSGYKRTAVPLVPGLGSPQAENGRGIQELKEPQNLPAACEAGRLIVRRYFGPGPTTEQRYTSFVTWRVICPAAAAARTSASEVNW